MFIVFLKIRFYYLKQSYPVCIIDQKDYNYGWEFLTGYSLE